MGKIRWVDHGLGERKEMCHVESQTQVSDERTTVVSEFVRTRRGREAYRGIACTWHPSMCRLGDQSRGEDFCAVVAVGSQPLVRRTLQASSRTTLVLRR